MTRLLNIFENLFLFVFMHQMVQEDQLSKIFSAVHPLTATSIYSNNQSKLLLVGTKSIRYSHRAHMIALVVSQISSRFLCSARSLYYTKYNILPSHHTLPITTLYVHPLLLIQPVRTLPYV
jgi:hypothetical protein